MKRSARGRLGGVLGGVLLLLCLARGAGAADRFVGDTAIYTEPGPASVPAANVLLLIDVGAVADSGETTYLDLLRESLPSVLTSMRDRLRCGVMVYGGEGRGGRLLYPVSDLAGDDDFSRFTATLTALAAEVPATGGSSLAEALYDGQFYFNKDRATNLAPLSATELSVSPLDAACQKNVMIVLAPGAGAGEPITERADRLPLDDADQDGYLADDVARQAYAGDLSATLDDRQNLRTHAVALGAESDRLRAVVEDGRGVYRRGDSEDALRAAVGAMLDNLVAEAAASFTAPTAPLAAGPAASSQSRVYLGLFKPRAQRSWLGNLKKFAINTKNQLVDRRGVLALCPDPLDSPEACAGVAEGDFKPTAVSFWSDRADGGVVEHGGAGAALLAEEDAGRRLYANLSDRSDLTHPNNAVTAANLGPERLQLDDAEAAAKLIAYLHGLDAYDEDGDGVATELREWVLGDILHSRPTVVHYRRYPLTAEAESDPDINRTVIFVGGNDGMLHAFRDADGRELWAFVPDVLLPDLRELAGTGHGYFVDGTAVAFLYDRDGDGNLGPGPEGANDDADPPGIVDDGLHDRAVLFFGLRRGGGAYYALDVTEPETPKFLWKFDRATVDGEGRALFPEMGETWSEPRLAQVQIGGVTQDVAFIGAGYDVAEDSRYGATAAYPQPLAPEVGAGPLTSAGSLAADQVAMTGRGVYAFAVATRDALGVPLIAAEPRRVWGWTVLDDPRLDRPIPSDITVLDDDGDGYAERLYVADLGGRLWRFAVGAGDPANWSGELIFSPSAAAGRKVFYRPSVARAEDHWLVAYGSGDRAHPLNTAVTDRFYLIRDRGQTTDSAIADGDLVDVTDDALQLDTTDEAERRELLAALFAEDCHGWRLDLDRLDREGQPGGEKVLAAPLIFNKVVYFTTYMPDAPSALASAPCVVGNPGVARLYAVDYRTGEAVLNFHLDNDGEEATVVNQRAVDPSRKILRRADRGLALGTGIPSGVVTLLAPDGAAEMLVGVGGRWRGTSATAGGVVHPLYWREW